MSRASYRIFISSPGDVGPERRRAALVVEKLAREFARFLDVAAYLWEYEPMLASGHFQDVIAPPAEHDLVVMILWSRLGTPLPERTAQRRYRGLDGRSPVTGTEWEFDDALGAHRDRGRPDLLVYRKQEAPLVSLADEALRVQAEAQWQALAAFWARYFVADGEFKTAYAGFSVLDEFAEKLEADLRRVLQQRVEALCRSQAGDAAPGWVGNPFRGLQAYGLEDAALFFGRSAATHACVEQLLQQQAAGRGFVLVRGASGSGKSSLVQAGVLPALMAPGVVSGAGLWRTAICRPAGHAAGAFMALAEALLCALPELQAQAPSITDLAVHLQHNADTPLLPLQMVLEQIAREARSRQALREVETAWLVILVDQLEELFDDARLDADQQAAFVRCLAALAGGGRILVLATLRSDCWHQAGALPELIALAQGPGSHDLLPPGPAELGEMLRRPAALAGIAFEVDARSEIGLDARLLEQAVGQPGSLPLLSFLLDALYQADIESGGGSCLRHATAAALGGLGGAIAQRAEQILLAQPVTVQAALPRLLRALARVEGGQISARTVALQRLCVEPVLKALVEALQAPQARLLVRSGDAGDAQVRVAHEALFSHWQRAREQLQQDRRDLETRGRIEAAATLWQAGQQRDERRGRLLRDLALAEAQDLARRWGDELPPQLSEFIQASLQQRRKEGRRRGMAVAAVIGGLSLTTAVSLVFALRTNQVLTTITNAATDLTRTIATAHAQGQGLAPDRLAAIVQGLDGVTEELVRHATFAPDVAEQLALTRDVLLQVNAAASIGAVHLRRLDEQVQALEAIPPYPVQFAFSCAKLPAECERLKVEMDAQARAYWEADLEARLAESEWTLSVLDQSFPDKAMMPAEMAGNYERLGDAARYKDDEMARRAYAASLLILGAHASRGERPLAEDQARVRAKLAELPLTPGP